MRRAVVDVGSNSVLLVVAEEREGTWQPIHETSRVTALGAGTKVTGLLSEEGMLVTLAALREAFALAREVGAEQVVAAATMAARIATNTEEFRQRAVAQDTPVVVLSGEDEAELGFLSVAEDPQFAGRDRLSIVDVGGHSTEIVVADRESDGWKKTFRKSFAIGTLALRSGVLSDESPGPGERMAAVRLIDSEYGFVMAPGEGGQCVALGATATNLITIREGMSQWEPDKVHGALLDYEEISRAVGWLCDLTDAQRAAVVGMEPGREKTMHIGALILERALYALRLESCSVSVRGWRHALLGRLDEWRGFTDTQ